MQPRLSDRVVGIGEATVDQMGVAPRSAEVEIELHRFSVQAGGAVGTALATVCAFGGQARYVGRLSDDEFGQIILRGLKEFGVDTSQVLIEPGKISPASFILVDERTGRRIVRYTRGSITPLEPGELPRELLDDAALLLVDGRVPAAQIAAAERAKALGVPVLLDARHLGPGMGELLDLSDAVIGSERFAAEVAHSSDVKRSLREIVKLGPRVAVLTLGEEGAIGLESDAIVRAAAVPVEMYDSTGSSDVFRGAFAYGMLSGWSLERSLPFANAAAGLNCRHLGGLGGIPSLAEVMRTAGL
ncbi:MAG: sulfofructose kinase [Myxococcales bacterium]|jgi:sugar/nucleoside kinase (ribokinase family)|nr:sulfofructose kinase [Myxococcales bacterium]